MLDLYRVVILGVIGVVGMELLELLEIWNFLVGELKFLVLEFLVGKILKFKE